MAESIGRTFSHRQEDKLFEKLRKINVRAEQYILAIKPNTWRNTEWTRITNLPPRYGICTSNNSEATNSMFKDARNYNWLKSLEQMFHLMQVRIHNLKNTYKNRNGLISQYKHEYKRLYNECINYKVIPVNEETLTYKVYMGDGEDYNHHKTHVIDVRKKSCTCGFWQDRELLCLHAMAYHRQVKEKTLNNILDMDFCPYYSYEYLHKLYKENITPVIIEALISDKTTKPPPESVKRPASRPTTKRIRKRRKSDVSVKCSNCGRKGHNKSTCPKPVGWKMMVTRGEVQDDESVDKTEKEEESVLSTELYVNNNRSENSYF